MLRAARFEAKLGFDIDPDTAEPIGRLRELLGGVPPARLFDELLKLFLTGHGARSLEVLRQRGLLAQLLPSVDAYLTAHAGGLVERLLLKGLANTDARASAGRAVTPTFLLALLLYGPIAQIIESMPPEKWHELSAIGDACDRAVRQAQAHIAIARRFSLGLREMFSLQPRLEHPTGRRALRSLTHPRFRAAYDLLLLRAELGLASPEMARWWTQVQEVSQEEQGRMADALAQAGAPQRPRTGRRRRRRGGRGPRAS
jgi:poly(A) polymerase